MIKFFIDKLDSKYWTHGSTWEFDWYIDLFFAEVMAYGSVPIKIGYMQPILGDEFLNFKHKDIILYDFKDFYTDTTKVKILLENQSRILKAADNLIANLKEDMFNEKDYEIVQKHLSLLMASVSVVFDELMPDAIEKISKVEDVSYSSLVNYVLDNSNKTKLNESNQLLLDFYKKNREEFTTNPINYAMLNKRTLKFFDSHSKQFEFINTGERGGKPWTPNDYVSQMIELTKIEHKDEKGINIKKLSVVSQKRLEYIIQINTNDNRAADKQVELDFLFQQFLEKKLGTYYKESIIEFLSYSEICSLLKTPDSIKQYQSRENNTFRVAWQEDGHIQTYYFKSEKEFTDVVKKVQSEESGETIVGTVACKGITEGVVHIIRNKADLNEFQKGEILVAEKTQPQYVMAMTKANAIVTDVGGVTSHAAIIAREFGIPSIVGTKNATKLLKNGDRIKVDANTGKIYKI